MSSRSVEAGYFSPDIAEFIRLLHGNRVEYVVVGGESVIFHGYPRLTGDIGFFYGATVENSNRLFEALRQFWEGEVPGIRSADEFLEPGLIVQFGRLPNRIDLLNSIDGVTFLEAWANRITVEVRGSAGVSELYYIDKETLLRNKRASGRAKDLDDCENLER